MQHLERRGLAVLFAAALTATVVGCGDDDPGASGSGGDGVGASGSGGAGAAGTGGTGTGGAGQGCHQTPAPEDATRLVVIAHPYDENGDPAGTYEALELAADGSMSATGQSFTMGRAPEGEIAFSPDGQIGIAVHDDGTLGVFRVTDSGIEVVHERFEGTFYAGRVWIPPSADHAIVLDPNWVENGGGIYRVDLACDGTLTEVGMLAPSKLAHRAVPLDVDAGEYLVAARSISDVPEGDDLHHVSVTDAVSHLASVDAFGDDEAIVASLALTANGRHALIGDNSAFSGIQNRVTVASLDGGVLSSIQTVSPVEDPVDIVTSPFDDRAIVVSAFGDAIFELSYDPDSANAPFSMLGELSYTDGAPQLPVDAVTIDRGALAGRVLVAEVSGVRSLQFEVGSVTDLGLWDSGMGLERIVGAIGVQP